MDMELNPEEITRIIEHELEQYQPSLEMEDVGSVLQVGDSIAIIYGLQNAMAGELLEFPNGMIGVVLNLEENSVGAAIFGDDTDISEGDIVKRTNRIASVPVGDALVGRVVNALGQPIDGKGAIATEKYRNIEGQAPNVVSRQPVKEPLMTGLKAIDSMIPIGRGQRELIIGDRQTGKTAIAIDTILNQKSTDMFCIYVAIGQKASSIAAFIDTLEKHGAMEYTTVVAAPADEPASLQYIAPYAGCAMGEEWLYTGKHALCIYDDLSKHAAAYRQLALLLRRPPGREAYPGDIFYCHSRLLERAAKMNDNLKGGSLTALPIIETQAGDVSAYIPTNVISITDGQIYLEPDLFYAGQLPAINVGLSVSRVGGHAQTKAMKSVGGKLRLDLAQYRELKAFAQFGSDLDKATLSQITRGMRLEEVLKQDQYQPLTLAEQIICIFSATQGYLDDIAIEKIEEFDTALRSFVNEKYPDIPHDIETNKVLTDETHEKLAEAVKVFKESFLEEQKEQKEEKKEE